jgi:hypothetical protein
MPSHQTEEMKRCLQNCEDCHRICLETATYCLEKGGRHTEPAHLRLLLDCAQICHTSGDFLTRGSDLHTMTCGACSEICARCAESCERMGDDEQMRRCAETCRRCSESCARMAGQHQMAGEMAGAGR